MTRPAGLRSQGSPFVRQKKKGGGQKLGLDLERIVPSYNHKQREVDNLEALQFLRDELQLAETEGRYAKARKIRRLINQELEVNLYLRRSWCYGCDNVLHNCQCQFTGGREVVVIIDMPLSHSAKRAQKRAQKEAQG